MATVLPETNQSVPKRSVPLMWRMLSFGTGFGIAVAGKNLEAAIVRSRVSGPSIVAAATIRDFRTRPAAEWGAELLQFLRDAHEKQLAATVLLPRDEVIVRTLHLPGVPDKDLASAVGLQVETLHPYGDDQIAWAHTRAGRDSVMIGLMRKAVLDSYETLFSEAGVPMAAATFSSAVIHAALRISGPRPADGILAFATDDRGRIEVYGESDARAVYSAAFSVAPQRALALSRAELRLPPDFPAQPLAEALTGSAPANPMTSPFAYAAAAAASAPLLSRFANLLPPDRRASNARRQYLLPVILGLLLLLALAATFVIFPAIEHRDYLNGLNAETRRLEPLAQRAQTLDRRIAAQRSRIAALDDFRRRSQSDLDVLNELTRILPAQVWVNSIEIYPDSVVIAGEAEQAGPLLKLLDSSPLFQNSEFALSVTHNALNEQFRLKTMRRNRIGRSTP